MNLFITVLTVVPLVVALWLFYTEVIKKNQEHKNNMKEVKKYERIKARIEATKGMKFIEPGVTDLSEIFFYDGEPPLISHKEFNERVRFLSY